jgi:hypothetical protein
MERLIQILLFTLASLAANTAESPRPVFIHHACDDKISYAVISSLKEEIRTSQKYQLVPTLDDNGRMDVVLTIQMSCTERNDAAAVATVYGKGKCFGHNNCHGAFDVSSLRADFCDSNAAVECGRSLFKAFDDYTKRPSLIQLRLE